jgi:hypothetical protein
LEILLSGPPSLALMLIEPGVQVNPVENQAPAQAKARHAQLDKQRDPDAQVDGGLLLRQAAHGRQRQIRLVHHRPCLAR